jgi:hypothetical protein
MKSLKHRLLAVFIRQLDLEVFKFTSSVLLVYDKENNLEYPLLKKSLMIQ